MSLAAQRGLEGQQELVAQGTGQPTGLSPSLTGVAMLPAPPRPARAPVQGPRGTGEAPASARRGAVSA